MASLEDLHADLIVSSLAFLQIKDIASINVNSMFRAISNSNPLWEQLCASLWATKHSQFHLTPARRESLLAADAEGAAETSWKQRCEHSLKDGKRTALTGPKELSSLVFDFRFRAKPEFSVSRNFCFDSGSGRVVGHPNGLTYQWTVNRSGRVVTLGLFPPAHVRRLKNWGWALVNPNIVLVSTFSHGAAAGIAGGEKEEESDSSSSGRELGTSVNAGDSGDNGGASVLSTSATVASTDSALVRQHPELFEGRSREPSGAVRALMDMHPIEGFVLPAAPPRISQRPRQPAPTPLHGARPNGGTDDLPPSLPPSPPVVPFSGLGVYPRGEGAVGFGVPLGPLGGSRAGGRIQGATNNHGCDYGGGDDSDDDDLGGFLMRMPHPRNNGGRQRPARPNEGLDDDDDDDDLIVGSSHGCSCSWGLAGCAPSGGGGGGGGGMLNGGTTSSTTCSGVGCVGVGSSSSSSSSSSNSPPTNANGLLCAAAPESGSSSSGCGGISGGINRVGRSLNAQVGRSVDERSTTTTEGLRDASGGRCWGGRCLEGEGESGRQFSNPPLSSTTYEGSSGFRRGGLSQSPAGSGNEDDEDDDDDDNGDELESLMAGSGGLRSVRTRWGKDDAPTNAVLQVLAAAEASAALAAAEEAGAFEAIAAVEAAEKAEAEAASGSDPPCGP